MKSRSPTSNAQESALGSALATIQAEYLRANLYVANVGTTSVVLVVVVFFWDADLETELLVWAGIGLSSTVFRSLLMYVYRAADCF